MRDMEPVRLFESGDAPSRLQDLLRRAQLDVPTTEQAARLVQSVEAQMAAPAGVARPATRRPSPVRAGRLPGKLTLAVILAGVGTVGYLTVQRQASTPAPAVDVPNAVTPAPAPIPTTGSAVVVPLPVVNDQTETPASPKARNTPRARGKHREIARRPAALPAPEPAPAPAPEPERAPTEGVSADEFALLRAARQAVASHPVRALGLTEEHARRFPAGMLAQEREAIAIEALAKLGREAQAQSRAQSFLKAHPGSPYKPRIDAALARMSGSRPPP